MLSNTGNYSKAINSYDSALQATPDDPYLLDLKGYSQFKADDFQGAISTLKKAVAADPSFAWAILI
jgi:tetratricopeptide (TPR) repeat protein